MYRRVRPLNPQSGLRAGGALLLMAAVLSPFISILGRLMPSRENSIVDELPAELLTLAVVGLAAVGVARVVFALVATRERTRLPEPSDADLLDGARLERRELRDQGDR